MKTFILEMTCKVKKSVVVEAESAEEAENNPWSNVVEEIETDMMDWEVDDVRRNG